MKMKRNMTKTAAVAVAVPALALGLAACSDDSSNEAVTVTETAAPETSAEATENSTEETAAKTSEESAATTDDRETPIIELDGKEIDASAFTPVRCEHGEDGGRPEIAYDAGQDDSENELDLEIITEPLGLDDFDLEHGGKDYEMDDTQKASATVEKQGEAYVITGIAQEDDSDRTVKVKITARC
ncbi:MAG TPA: lipoprotein LpqH [Candidatus Corynebacterium gallistercoris]|uniref:Lipoprotein LpqH n=1 Tax=Candidatus Corynebacterium gallistercoris TaxID=2838530 RepID=A0A9D1UQD2_9CORY|nr:lipoprotein LpqH [Candidatus Corynebacterium gallistercoris]